MEEENKKGIKLGIFIFAGLVFFAAGILAIGNINKFFTKTIEIITVFDEVSGLQPGANVWVSGVKVGTVKEMKFLPNADVEVKMKIEKKSIEYIPKNAKAKISSDGLIGSKIIVIYGGSQAAGHIISGDHLAYEKTNSTQDMLDMLQENNKNLLAITTDFRNISGKIVAGEGTVGKLISDDTLYRYLQIAATNLQKATDNTIRLTESINSYADQLNTEGGLAYTIANDTAIFYGIQEAVSKLNVVSETAIDIASDLKETSEGINTDKNSPIGVLLNDEQAAESIKTSISQLESSTAKLNESMEALQHNFLLRGFFKKKDKEEADTNK